MDPSANRLRLPNITVRREILIVATPVLRSLKIVREIGQSAWADSPRFQMVAADFRSYDATVAKDKLRRRAGSERRISTHCVNKGWVVARWHHPRHLSRILECDSIRSDYRNKGRDRIAKDMKHHRRCGDG